MKISVSLDDESTQLLMAMEAEFETMNRSQLIQSSIKHMAKSQGFYLIPARVERRED
jgi:hypothetical protein